MTLVHGEEKPECVFPGSSKMAQRMRTFDWASTVLGPTASWPPGLRAALAVMLGNPQPMLVWWGSQLVQFYNDSYAERMLGAAQPWALGRSARVEFSDAWNVIGPRVQSVVRSGNLAGDERVLLLLERNGYLEETYHGFAYAPIPDEAGNVGGITCRVCEQTAQVLATRRRQLLDELASCVNAGSSPRELVLQAAGRALESNPLDIPFALVYLLDAGSGGVRLHAVAGVHPDAPCAPPLIGRDILAEQSDGWAMGKVKATGRTEIVSRLGRRFGILPGGAWAEPTHTAAVVPMWEKGLHALAGFFICGVSPRRAPDEAYLAFLEQVAGLLGGAVAETPGATGTQQLPVPIPEVHAQDADAERMRIEEALRLSEARLAIELTAMSRLHDLSSRLLATTDMQAALREVLDAALAMLGAEMGNIQLYHPHKHVLEIVVQRGFCQEFLDYFRDLSTDDASVCAAAARGARRVVIADVMQDPDWAPLRTIAAKAGYRGVQSTPLISRNGTLLGILSTHFRHAHTPSERDLRMLDLYAIQAIDQIERIRAEEALKEADRRKDEFIAMLAHELRNPLAPIRNAIRMLPHAAEAGALERLQQMMERQADHMVRLVDDLMEVSRITTGKIELRRTLVVLADVLASAVETSMPNIDQARHRLNVSLAPDNLMVDADAVRLAQVFANLLNNAAKYTEDGGHIRLSARREGSEAVVEVIDSGIGIAPDMLGYVFDMYAQTIDAAGRWQGGIGLGLYLVRRLVEMHGGSVEACSAGAGRGSRFVVRLPLVEGCPRAMPGDVKAASAEDLRQRRVLIVDDNRDAAESLTMLLEHFGAQVQMAHDGPAALQAIDAGTPDAVLLDIGMPGMNGYEVARRVRAQPRFNPVLLVALSGWGGEEDRRRSQECGFDHHLVKPVDIAVLRALLARQ